MPSATSELVRGLQERTARALPPSHISDVDGWWLRHAPGCSWWVGTVLPHEDASPDELGRRVAGAEEFYAGRGSAARFQISPGASPGLDGFLGERGYQREHTMSLQVAPTARVAADPAPRVRVEDRPTRAWFETWRAVHGGDERSEWEMLARVDRSSAYACALAGERVVAVGRAVADDGWAGVFGMATLPEARGRGAARGVLTALAAWAGTRRADHLYLQVEPDNVPARRLYERAGFGELCTYHYRSARPSG